MNSALIGEWAGIGTFFGVIVAVITAAWTAQQVRIARRNEKANATHLSQYHRALDNNSSALKVHAESLQYRSAITLLSQRSQVILHCNSRYDDLYKFRTELERLIRRGEIKQNEIEEEAKSYFRRFWGLKSDQLDYWFAGYIDPETLASWFMSVIDSFGDSEKMICGMRYLSGWELVCGSHDRVNEVFLQFVDQLKSISLTVSDPTERYARLIVLLQKIETTEAAYIEQLTERTLDRLTVVKFRNVLKPSVGRRVDDIISDEKERELYPLRIKRSSNGAKD